MNTITRWSHYVRLIALLLGAGGLGSQALAVRAVAAEASPALPKATEVIEKYLQALGGRDLVSKSTSAHSKGTLEIPGTGMQGTVESFAAKPNLFRLLIDLPGIGTADSGYNGKVGWSVHPALGAQLLEGEELDQLKEQANYNAALHAAADYPTLETVARVTFEGKDCHKLRLVSKAGQESFEYFEVSTGLLVGTEAEVASPLGKLPVKIVISDYKPLGGRLQATKMTQVAAGQTVIITTTSVEYDQVDPKSFEPPAEIKALIGG